MNTKYLTIFILLTLLMLTACGPAPTPTLNAEDVANTAIADAWVAVTQTQAAIPTATATLIPTVTFTPLPTFTPIPISTLPPLIVPTATISAADDPCNQPPPIKPNGAQVKVKFVNKSGGHVDLSFGMTAPNNLKECGTYGFSLGAFDEPVVTVLAGCYWGYAWITGKTPSVAKTGDTILCVTDPSVERAIWITIDTIGFH